MACPNLERRSAKEKVARTEIYSSSHESGQCGSDLGEEMAVWNGSPVAMPRFFRVRLQILWVKTKEQGIGSSDSLRVEVL